MEINIPSKSGEGRTLVESRTQPKATKFLGDNSQMKNEKGEDDATSEEVIWTKENLLLQTAR